MDFYLQRALDAIRRETTGMSGSLLGWHPEGKWSTAQILEHLSLAFSGTCKAMDRCLQQEHGEVRKPTARERLATLVVVKIGYFPSGRPAPEFTRPQGLQPEQAMDKVRATLVEMDTKIAEAEGKFGSGLLGVHPVIGPLTAKQWRKFHWEHTRHHMKQIRRLRAGAKAQAASA